jgi:3-phenylpropionate/trans-cinnamate dioxygenase ferredoxin component
MTRWHDVTAEGDIEPGGFALVETDDLTAAVFNVDGSLHAIEDVCTHDGAELAGGPVVGDQVVCPRHGARFCLRTGRALTPPAYAAVQTFPVRVSNGRIEVELPD